MVVNAWNPRIASLIPLMIDEGNSIPWSGGFLIQSGMLKRKEDVLSGESRRVRILGTASSVPGTILDHEQLDARYGFAPGTSLKQTGVKTRFLSTTETASFLAVKACNEALLASGMSWDDVDCLVAASATMDQALPYNAAMIHAELGLQERRTTTFDIGASCMSFLTALDICSTLIDAGRFRRVMIVSADISTFTTDCSDLRTNGIFGDGAAACLIGRAEEGEAASILGARSMTLSEGVTHCQIRAGGSRFHRRVPNSNGNSFFEMNPRPLYGLIAREMPGFVKVLLEDVGLAMRDIDLVVPHQASALALKHITRMLKLPSDRMVDISSTHANQVGASLPTALHFGLGRADIQRGSKLLLLGSGAGVTIGGMVLVY